MPDPPSRFMCRYTAELVALLDPDWVIVLGLVDGGTHAWNERRADGWFCDLTGDQFGRPAVQLRVGRPPGYVENLWTDSSPEPFRYRATQWLRKIDAVEAFDQGQRHAGARTLPPDDEPFIPTCRSGGAEEELR
ncbi:hypothetical protein ACU61A_39245 [Pseudonocardia sichuanensis]